MYKKYASTSQTFVKRKAVQSPVNYAERLLILSAPATRADTWTFVLKVA
jgi:hypothetical protein